MKMQPTEKCHLPTKDEPLANNSNNGGGTPKKILVVEDDFLTALNLKEDLMMSGFEVPAIAKTGKEAISMATEVLPDLILMDITLDGPMSGIEAAAEIRKAHAIPIIYLTAHADAKTIDNAKTTAPFGYLPKPCSVVTMVSAIEVALSKNKIDTERQRLERQSFEDELLTSSVKLQEANTALKVLLEQRDLERCEVEQNIQTNVSKLILPSVCALENSKMTESQRISLESIKINLQLLTEAHVSQFGGSITKLSSTEMQVANFVKAGKSTKEIAQFLDIASSTVNTHRDSIRKKLGIKNMKMNLKKELQKTL